MAIDWNMLLNDCVQFTQQLIQTPSMPHEEAMVAELIAAEMQQLQFDQVWLDDIGNVYGRIYGQDRSLPALVLNSHTDHVDPGDHNLWPVPPFSGEIVDGRILGRGACDIKGPLAVQLYSMAAFKRHHEQPLRDVVFCGVVQEEIGGAGAKYWVENLNYPVALVILGEPSDNNIALGHRGIWQVWVTFNGRSVHASVPEKGDNPNYALANFLSKLADAKENLRQHPILGKTTVSPTVMCVDTTSINVTPAWARVLLDFRTAAESPNSLIQFINAVAGTADHTIGYAWANDPTTPVPTSDEIIYGFYTPPDSTIVQRAQQAIGKGMGHEPALTSYRFATDGRHFTPYGIPIIGYSPSEEHLAHTIKESIAINKMEQSLKGHVQLLREF